MWNQEDIVKVRENMKENQLKITIGGLFHDIGKVFHRGSDGRNHSRSGYDFLQETNLKDELILEQVLTSC